MLLFNLVFFFEQVFCILEVNSSVLSRQIYRFRLVQQWSDFYFLLIPLTNSLNNSLAPRTNIDIHPPISNLSVTKLSAVCWSCCEPTFLTCSSCLLKFLDYTKPTVLYVTSVMPAFMFANNIHLLSEWQICLAGMDDEDDESLALHEVLDDKLRVRYYKGYLAAVAQSIRWYTMLAFGS